MQISLSKSLGFPFNVHRSKWDSCSLCSLSCGRSSVAFYRGRLPCTVLFVADAPDEPADIFGVPFPDSIVPSEGSILSSCFPTTATSAVTYLVSCGPTRTPDLSPEQRSACWPKFIEFIGLAQPKIVVCIGKVCHGFYINHMNDVITKLNRRPISLGMNGLFWLSNQKDYVLEAQKIRLSIEDCIERYVHE